jgi:hypothetical protein
LYLNIKIAFLHEAKVMKVLIVRAIAVIIFGSAAEFLDKLHSGSNQLDSKNVLLVFCLNYNEVFHGDKGMCIPLLEMSHELISLLTAKLNVRLYGNNHSNINVIHPISSKAIIDGLDELTKAFIVKGRRVAFILVNLKEGNLHVAGIVTAWC